MTRMASRYEQVKDVDTALKYYEAGLLLRQLNLYTTPKGKRVASGHVYVEESSFPTGDAYAWMCYGVGAGYLYVLVEED